MCGRVEASDGFWVMLAVLWCVDETNVLPVFLAAALTHELGHLLVLYLTDGRLNKLSLTAFGAVLNCDLPESHLAKTAVCLAGPASSFLLTAAAGGFELWRLSGASVLLGAFNLLPLPPLDGGMALYHLTDGGLTVLRYAAALAAILLLCGGGLLLALNGGGCWLLLMGLVLSLSTVKRLAKGETLV